MFFIFFIFVFTFSLSQYKVNSPVKRPLRSNGTHLIWLISRSQCTPFSAYGDPLQIRRAIKRSLWKFQKWCLTGYLIVRFWCKTFSAYFRQSRWNRILKIKILRFSSDLFVSEIGPVSKQTYRSFVATFM